MDKQEIIEEIMTRVVKKINDIEQKERESIPEVKVVEPVKEEIREVKSCSSCSSSKPVSESGNAYFYDKKLLSEKCLKELVARGVRKITYKKGTIVTAAASEIAKIEKVEIERIS